MTGDRGGRHEDPVFVDTVKDQSGGMGLTRGSFLLLRMDPDRPRDSCCAHRGDYFLDREEARVRERGEKGRIQGPSSSTADPEASTL